VQTKIADGNILSLLLLKLQDKHLDTKPERKYWWDARYDGGKKKMVMCTFRRRP